MAKADNITSNNQTTIEQPGFGFTLKTATNNGMYVHVLENAEAYSGADSRSFPHEKQCPNCDVY